MHNGDIITTRDLIESEYFDDLVLRLVAITSFEKAERFIKAVLTPKEAYLIGQRTLIVAFLEEGRTYRDIAKTLRVSFSTIARAARQIQDERFPVL
jgi:uncharacterized protein YerC